MLTLSCVQIRHVEGLPSDSTCKAKFTLNKTTELLSCPGIAHDSLKRYFWGITTKKNGARITKEKASAVEKLLNDSFDTVQVPQPSQPLRQPAPTKPSAVGAVPLHTVRTRFGMAVTYDFGNIKESVCDAWKWRAQGQTDTPSF